MHQWGLPTQELTPASSRHCLTTNAAEKGKNKQNNPTGLEKDAKIRFSLTRRYKKISGVEIRHFPPLQAAHVRAAKLRARASSQAMHPLPATASAWPERPTATSARWTRELCQGKERLDGKLSDYPRDDPRERGVTHGAHR